MEQPSEFCILVAEDDAIFRYLIVSSLSDCGYCVLESEDGVEALEVARSCELRPIHLLISDLNMPRMNGNDLVQHLKNSHPEILVLLVTGSHSGALSPELTSQVQEVLRKPVHPDVLVEHVWALLVR